MRYFYIYLYIFIICGCQNKGYKHVQIIASSPTVINIDKSSSYYPLNTVIDSIWYISLQSNDTIPSSGRVDKILLVEKKIYTLDVRLVSIKVYDLSGKFLYDIGGLGFKKGEYRRIADIAYNKFRNSLYVLCNSPSKTVLEYSLEGKFIREIPLLNGATGIGIDNVNTLYYYLNHGGENKNRNYNLAIADSNNNLKDALFPVPSNIKARIGLTGGLYSCNDTFYFNPPLTNTFYSVTDSFIGRKRYYINFGKDSLPTSFGSLADMMSNLKKYSLLGKSMVIGSDFIGFNFVEKGGLFKQAFVNRSSGNIAKTDSTSPINSLLYYDVFQSHDTLMTATYIRELRHWIKDCKKTIQSRIPGLYEEVTNPNKGAETIIVLYKLKPF